MLGGPASKLFKARHQWSRLARVEDSVGRVERVGIDDATGVAASLGYEVAENQQEQPQRVVREEDGERVVYEIRPDGSEWLLGRVGSVGGVGIMTRPPRKIEPTIPGIPAPVRGPSQEAEPGVATEVTRGVVTGLNQAVEELNDTLGLTPVVDWLEERVPLREAGLGFYERPQTAVGEGVAGLAQGTAAMIPAARALRGLGVANNFLRWTLAGAAADFAAFSPDDPGLGELAQAIGALDNETAESVRAAIVRALAKDEDDGELAKRLKNVGGGALAGAAIDGLVAAYRGVRGIAKNPEAMRRLVEQVPEARGILREMQGALADESGAFNVKALGGGRKRLLRGVEQAAEAPPKPPADVAPNMPKGGPEVIAEAWKPFKAGDPVEGIDFNFRNLDTTDAVKRQINNISKAYAKEIDKVKKGTIPQELTRQIADLTATDPSKVKKIVADFEAGAVEDLHVKALVMRKALVESAEGLDSLARRIAEGDETVSAADHLAFREHLARHATLQAQMKGVQTEIARALAAFKIPADAPSVERGQIARDILDHWGGEGTAREMARRYLDTPLEKRAKFVEKAAYARLKDVIFEIWINGLLSGVRTHTVNTVSNALFASMQVPERLLAGAFGAARSVVPGGTSDRVYMGEALAMMRGLPAGLADGLRLAWQSFRYDRPSDALTKAEISRMRAITPEKFGLDPQSWAGRAVDYFGQGVRLPGRFLMAEDEFFKAVGYRMELHAQAYRRAMQARALGAPEKEAAEICVNVLEGGDAAARAAAQDAMHVVTFTKELGAVGQNAQRFFSSWPMGRVLVPFIRTPTNIMKEFGKRSPVALAMPKSFWAEVAAGGARRDLALAKLSAGTAMMIYATNLALEGKITGGGPADPRLRQHWLETHQPYSIRVGDQWIPYGRLEPVAMLFGVAADFADFMTYAEPGTDDDQLAAMAVGAVLHNLGEKSFFTGPAMAAAAWNDPERYAGRFVQQLVGSVVPTMVADIESATAAQYSETGVDPNADFFTRQFYTALNAMKARTPGWSDDLPPARTFWGEPIKVYDGHWLNAFWAFRTKDIKESPIDEELLRLTYPLSKPRKEIDGVKLSPEQYDRLLVLMNSIKDESTENKSMREFFNSYIQSPDYMLLPDADKIERLRKIRGVFLDAAKRALLEEDPDLFARVTTARALREAGLAR